MNTLLGHALGHNSYTEYKNGTARVFTPYIEQTENDSSLKLAPHDAILQDEPKTKERLAQNKCIT